MTDCSVKTKDGTCCKFPFLYKGTEQTECVKGKAGNWCGVSYNYDKEKKWGWCEGNSESNIIYPKMAKIYTLFQSKTAQKTTPFGATHTDIAHVRD